MAENLEKLMALLDNVESAWQESLDMNPPPEQTGLYTVMVYKTRAREVQTDGGNNTVISLSMEIVGDDTQLSGYRFTVDFWPNATSMAEFGSFAHVYAQKTGNKPPTSLKEAFAMIENGRKEGVFVVEVSQTSSTKTKKTYYHVVARSFIPYNK